MKRLAALSSHLHRRQLSSAASAHWFLEDLGLSYSNSGVFHGTWAPGNGPELPCRSPVDNSTFAVVKGGDLSDYETAVARMAEARVAWASTPAPIRGEVVRKIGEALRQQKKALGALVSLEVGKILAEGEGEVQEAIDICDFAVGLSRTYSGAVIPSERAGHVMLERWLPLNGPVGVITAFNFPLAVYFWNAALSLVVGNVQVWKPADTTPLIAVAATKIIEKVFREQGFDPAVCSLVAGPGPIIGDAIAKDPRVPLVSFTGSTLVGRKVASAVAGRFGKSILELGGNNAVIIMPDADLNIALRGVLFAAVGTAGQRCTTLRRLYLHSEIYDSFVDKLKTAYKSVKIGNPLDKGVLCGPLHSKAAVEKFRKGIEAIKERKTSKIIVGGNVGAGEGNFVEPTIVETDHEAPFVKEELFAPILYVIKVDSLDEAIKYNNDVPQGLSSSLFTKDIRNVFKWTGEHGSDCGIVNVNIGPSGAEIGGAFGGEKETGGGRESGSDSWKQYCRRSTCTINFSDKLPLAQGINFG